MPGEEFSRMNKYSPRLFKPVSARVSPSRGSILKDSSKAKAEFLQKVSLRLAKYRLCNVYCIISMSGRFSSRKNFGHTIMSALFNVPKVVFCARPCV